MGTWDDIPWNTFSTRCIQKAILRKCFLTVGNLAKGTWKALYPIYQNPAYTGFFKLLTSVISPNICYLNKSLVTIFLFSSLSSVKKLSWSPLFSPITRLWEPIYQLLCLQMMSFAKCFAAFPIIFFSRLMEFWSPGKRKEQTPSTSSQKHTYIFVRHSFPVSVSSYGAINQFLSGSDLIPKLLSCLWHNN